MTNTITETVLKEVRMLQAIEAFQAGQFQNIRRIADLLLARKGVYGRQILSPKLRPT